MTECPVCRNQQFSTMQLITNVAVKTCTRCDFRISNIRRVEPAESEFSRIHDEAYRQSIGKVRRRQAGEVLSLVERHAKEGGEWLDVGCSFGYLLLAARQAGFKVCGVEPDEKAVRYARELVGDDLVRHGLMNEETTPDLSADVISTLDVLEHIPADALSNFARMIHHKLRPGGLWVIKAPSTEGLYFTLAHSLLPFGGPLMSGVVKRLWQSEYEYPHTVYFSLRTLGQFLVSHGFEVVASKYLAEVPNSTVMDRLLMDDTIPRWQAVLSAPAFYLINFIEGVRGKSDALLMLARRKSAGPAV